MQFDAHVFLAVNLRHDHTGFRWQKSRKATGETKPPEWAPSSGKSCRLHDPSNNETCTLPCEFQRSVCMRLVDIDVFELRPTFSKPWRLLFRHSLRLLQSLSTLRVRLWYGVHLEQRPRLLHSRSVDFPGHLTSQQLQKCFTLNSSAHPTLFRRPAG